MTPLVPPTPRARHNEASCDSCGRHRGRRSYSALREDEELTVHGRPCAATTLRDQGGPLHHPPSRPASSSSSNVAFQGDTCSFGADSTFTQLHNPHNPFRCLVHVSAEVCDPSQRLPPEPACPPLVHHLSSSHSSLPSPLVGPAAPAIHSAVTTSRTHQCTPGRAG